MLTMPLVGGADLNGTASSDSTDLRFNRPYRARPTGFKMLRWLTVTRSRHIVAAKVYIRYGKACIQWQEALRFEICRGAELRPLQVMKGRFGGRQCYAFYAITHKHI
eukprot:1822214-Pleurochrysis_carterae.AAC.3